MNLKNFKKWLLLLTIVIIALIFVYLYYYCCQKNNTLQPLVPLRENFSSLIENTIDIDISNKSSGNNYLGNISGKIIVSTIGNFVFLDGILETQFIPQDINAPSILKTDNTYNLIVKNRQINNPDSLVTFEFPNKVIITNPKIQPNKGAQILIKYTNGANL